MKILLLYTYNRGYLSSFFHELSSMLFKNGHDVVNFSWKASASEFVVDNIKIIVKKKGSYLTNYLNVYNIINKEKPDVILSNFSYVNPALLFGTLFRVKKNMVWFHSLNEQMESSALNIFIKKQFLKLANLVIANSYLTQNELQTIYKVPMGKLTSIPFWSNISKSMHEEDTSKYSKDPIVIKIGCPGRMVQHKNQRIVIETASKLKQKEHFNFKLYLAGNGQELANLQLLTQDLGLESHVSFLGHLSADDMVTFYSLMDVVVLPSLHEAFGLVFVEAISLGTPVIVSSRFGALSFIKKNKLSKFTFNPESSDELAEMLLSFYKNDRWNLEDFKQLYNENFDKTIIFNQIYKEMTG